MFPPQLSSTLRHVKASVTIQSRNLISSFPLCCFYTACCKNNICPAFCGSLKGSNKVVNCPDATDNMARALCVLPLFLTSQYVLIAPPKDFLIHFYCHRLLKFTLASGDFIMIKIPMLLLSLLYMQVGKYIPVNASGYMQTCMCLRTNEPTTPLIYSGAFFITYEDNCPIRA